MFMEASLPDAPSRDSYIFNYQSCLLEPDGYLTLRRDNFYIEGEDDFYFDSGNHASPLEDLLANDGIPTDTVYALELEGTKPETRGGRDNVIVGDGAGKTAVLNTAIARIRRAEAIKMDETLVMSRLEETESLLKVRHVEPGLIAMRPNLLFEPETYMLSPMLSPDNGQHKTIFQAKIDTGCTFTASGRKELFPEELMQHWDPDLRVKAANNSRMPVKGIGVMVTSPVDTPEGVNIVLAQSNALYVPAMGDLTLISPKQLFNESGIKCFLNGDPHLMSASGIRIDFKEDAKGYSINLSIPTANELSKVRKAWDDAQSKMKTAAAMTADVEASDHFSPALVHERFCHFSFDRIAASRHAFTSR
jgi:hypothetical protein